MSRWRVEAADEGWPEPPEATARRAPSRWETASPAEVGLDATRLEAAGEAIEQYLPNVTSLLVARRGVLAYERYFGGYGPEDAHNIKSVTKSVLSLLVGIALDSGDGPALDARVADLLPHLFEGAKDPRRRAISVRHLLTMTSVFEYVENSGVTFAYGRSPDYGRFAAGQPMSAAPGESFGYSSLVSHLLAIALADTLGESLLQLSARTLFEPLGIEPVAWPIDPQGYVWGDSGLRIRPRDLAKIGQLVLQGGWWGSRAIVSEGWIRESTALHVPQVDTELLGYAYHWWLQNVRGHRAIVARGFGGQLLVVMPSLDLVVVITSEPRVPENAPDVILGEWVVPAALEGRVFVSSGVPQP